MAARPAGLFRRPLLPAGEQVADRAAVPVARWRARRLPGQGERVPLHLPDRPRLRQEDHDAAQHRILQGCHIAEITHIYSTRGANVLLP